MIKIIVADDHAIVRAGIIQILSDDPGLQVIDEAGEGHELLSKVRSNDPDVVLLDMTMPGMDGLDVLKQLKIERPKLPVLILTIHPETQYALRVLKAGASGYITKSSAPDELIQAIKKVFRGGKYISPAFAEKLAFQLDTDFKELPHETLSDREYQVILLIASGKTVSEIADELSLSVKTISTYRSRILEKMNMKNNAELTRYVFEHQLLD
jgi:DNA-binding NarL/FixJ family response regulator